MRTEAYSVSGLPVPFYQRAARWAVVNTTGTPAFVDQEGASSITDNGAGDNTINWLYSWGSANYAVSGSAMNTGTTNATRLVVDIDNAAGPAVGATRFQVYALDGTLVDSTYVSIVNVGMP